MKESISYTYLLNMMLVFIVVSFLVLMLIFSYTKAYRVNSKIAGIIEKSEGYNDLAKSEINKLMSGLGYQRTSVTCRDRDNAITEVADSGYCIYYYPMGEASYYGITTFMIFNFPGFNVLRLPVYTVTEQIIDFTAVCCHSRGGNLFFDEYNNRICKGSTGTIITDC